MLNKVLSITFLLSTIGSGLSVPVFAQGVTHLTVDEAVSLSISNSGKLKVADAKTDEATANYMEAKNNKLPDVKLSGSYLRLNNPTIDLKMKSGSSSGSSTGGETQSGGGTPKVDQAAYGIANLSLPLFSGFRIKYGIESAKFLKKAAELDAEKDKEEVVQNAIMAYSNLYKAQKSVELVKENLAREEARVKDFSNLERNGLLARNDLLKAQLHQSQIELSLLEAENNLSIANENMNLMLGLPKGSTILTDALGYEKLPETGSLVAWETTALENRKDRAALEAREHAAGSAVKATTAEYYPGVALTGGYIAANVPNLLTLTNALNAGIGLQYNLGALWKAGAKVDAAKARLHQIQATEGMLADNIRLEINQAYHQYLLSLKKVKVYQKSVEQADENYRITKNKYDNNLVTTTELLEADVAQLQAQLNYAFSKTDAVVAYRKLQQTAGVLHK